MPNRPTLLSQWLLLLGIQTALLALAPTPSYSRPSDAARDLFIETAPNIKIHARVSGPLHPKHTLILIPGWRLTAAIWQEQFMRFSKDRRVIAIDSRSQG